MSKLVNLNHHYLYIFFKGRTLECTPPGCVPSKCVAISLRSFEKEKWTTNNVTISDDNEQTLCDEFVPDNQRFAAIDPILQLTVVKHLQKER